ncbi:MAG: hypothetical protein JWN22_2804 [Nocardioides sp.]|jgi:hypothetical protein|nr:hypothetical protein [Nocardioides sp.]
MRALVHDYVHAVHTTYLDHVQTLPPGERGELPLVSAGELTVIAAATTRLHLLATTDVLQAPLAPEVELTDEHRGVRWATRFYDPSVLPELGTLTGDNSEDVRRILGVTRVLYHLTVDVGGGLSAHHAAHSGVALANQHARTSRDLDRLRHALPRQLATVSELGTCVRLGLDRAASLLAADLTGGRVAPAPGTTADTCLAHVLRDVTR